MSMKQLLAVTGLLGLAALVLGCGRLDGRDRSTRKGGDWLTDFEEARGQAQAMGRPILADFTGSDWCGWCIRLDEEVFSTAEFEEWASQNVILLELDFPHDKELPDELTAQNRSLAGRYGIDGFPTILFLDRDGEVLGESGYIPGGPQAWIAHAESELR